MSVHDTPEPDAPHGVDASDLEVEDGCLGCGGALQIRLSYRRALAVCVRCRAVTEADVDVDGEQLVFRQQPATLA